MSKELKDAISCNDVLKLQEIFCTTNVGLNDCEGYNPLIHACADVNVRVPLVQSDYIIFDPMNPHRSESDVSDRLCNEIKDKGTVTPLILAVVDRNVELVRKLLQDCGADANVSNNAGLAPLHCISTFMFQQLDARAVQIEQEIADLLLKAGAEVNACDNNSKTPLHYAAEKLDPVLARILLQHGATVDSANKDGSTPLLVVIQAYKDSWCLMCFDKAKCIPQQTSAIVRLLLDKRANLTSRKHGLTPLHLAAEAGYLDIVKILVEAGADIHAEAPFTCLTPLDMAKHGKKQDVVDYLVTKAAENENKEGGRPKRDSPSVEQEEDTVSSQQTDTPVEESVEGAVGGIQQLDIKDEDSTDKE